MKELFNEYVQSLETYIMVQIKQKAVALQHKNLQRLFVTFRPCYAAVLMQSAGVTPKFVQFVP